VAILFTSSNLGEQIVSRAVLRMSTAWLTIREPAAPPFSSQWPVRWIYQTAIESQPIR
jgi:hypothetical protein